MEISFNRLRQGRVSDRVREEITSLIVQGKLKVGDQLPAEGEIARQFGVSRVPVREAVKGLEISGLLTAKRGVGGGIFVAEPSPEPLGEFLTLMLHLGKATIVELTEARLVIEPDVARLAAQRASAEDLSALEKTIASYQESVERNLPRTISDMDFHLRLAEACRNTVLSLTLKGLIPLLFRTVRNLTFSKEGRLRSIGEHHRVFEAVAKHDPGRAAQAMESHIRKMATYWE